MSPDPNLNPSWQEQILYRGRVAISIIALLFILYCAIYYWLYVPYDDFVYSWHEETKLIVDTVPSDSEAHGILYPGDQILAVNDRPVRRMHPTYPSSQAVSYTFTIKRQNQVSTVTIPVSHIPTSLTWQQRLPATILAIICWLTSALILALARPGQSQALHTGFIFTLAAIVIISLQASLDGTPLAWLGGHVLIFPLAVSWAHLGLLPRSTPFSPWQRNLYRLTLGISGALATAAGFEVMFLFPAGNSWHAMSGVSFYHLGLLLSAVGIFLMTSFLIRRLLYLPTNNYLRQQIKILLFFIVTATLPIAVLSLLPHVLTGYPWLPFPVSISLLGLAPAGYLYVIHRRGLLGLDRFFSRALTLIWLSLLLIGGFALGLWLARDYLATADEDSIAVVTILFFPALMTTMYLHAPIHRTVQRTLYGSTLDQQKLTLNQIAARLANKPEVNTLSQVLEEVTQDLTVAQALLLQRVNDAYYQSLVQLGMPESTVDHFATSTIPYLSHPLLRPREPRAAVWQDFPWAHLILPLYTREKQTGLLLLGQPQPDGYFNARQMEIAGQLATILAMAHENITLFEATRRMARQQVVV